MNFKIGQKVVALCTFRGIRKDSIYVINDIDYCSCGETAIDVDISHHFGTECECGRSIRNRDGVQWYAPTRFAPLVEDTESNEAMDELLKEAEELVKQHEVLALNRAPTP